MLAVSASLALLILYICVTSTCALLVFAPLKSQPVPREGCWGLCNKPALKSVVLWYMHLCVHALALTCLYIHLLVHAHAYVVCSGGTVKLCLQCCLSCCTVWCIVIAIKVHSCDRGKASALLTALWLAPSFFQMTDHCVIYCHFDVSALDLMFAGLGVMRVWIDATIAQAQL